MPCTKAHKKKMLVPSLPFLPKNKKVSTRSDPNDPHTINVHDAYNGLSEEIQLIRQKYFGQIKARWCGEEPSRWFPKHQRPRNLPQHPSRLEHTLARAIPRPGFRHRWQHEAGTETPPRHRGAESGSDVFDASMFGGCLKAAVRRRYEEIGYEKAKNLYEKKLAEARRPIAPLPKKKGEKAGAEATEDEPPPSRETTAAQENLPIHKSPPAEGTLPTQEKRSAQETLQTPPSTPLRPDGEMSDESGETAPQGQHQLHMEDWIRERGEPTRFTKACDDEGNIVRWSAEWDA